LPEFNSRKDKERRKVPCFIENDRRTGIDRRKRALFETRRKRRKEFERHLRAQR